MQSAMQTLSLLAGWRTIPHPEDRGVVRLALTDARAKTDAEVGGLPAQRATLDAIEDRWLTEVIGL